VSGVRKDGSKVQGSGFRGSELSLTADEIPQNQKANRRTAEYRTAACDELSRVEFRRMESLRSVF